MAAPHSRAMLRKRFADTQRRWVPLRFYEHFEQAVTLVLTAIIAIVVVAALWNLAVHVVVALILPGGFDPTDYGTFQAVFGMIFTVIIALEFKKSLLVTASRRTGVVQVRTVVVIALLAILRKLIILDLSKTEAAEIVALGAAILALGAVYWLTGDQDRRDDVHVERRKELPPAAR
jgi:uncharacterized membrane protein (DUF373 family)